MTSTTISEVKSKTMLWGSIRNQGKNQNVQGQECFSAVFDKTQNPSQDNNKENKSLKADEADDIQKYANIQETKTSRQLKEQGEKVKNANSEEVAETAGKMVEEIAATFNITVEEVESVLETLGLTAIDLLSTDILTQMVLALNPECDALSLMTNEELFADLKGLMNIAQELKKQILQEFNLTEAELMTKSEVTPENEVMTKTDFMSETEVMAEPEVMPEIEVSNDKITKISYGRNDVKTVEMTETFNESMVAPKTEISQEVRSSLAETGEDNGHAPAHQFAQNFMNQLTEAVENANNTTTTYSVSGQEIIQQITEQIKVHVKQDTTEMELQLHPASLGTVKVQLTSAGGVLTAVFTTENETVKAALEAQLIQLKENFTEQGLKVESVEVNVSAQGFERSLDQQEQEQNRFEDSRNKKATRRIRLNGLESSEEFLSEDMTADDKIVADMMIRNGNSVDYTV